MLPSLHSANEVSTDGGVAHKHAPDQHKLQSDAESTVLLAIVPCIKSRGVSNRRVYLTQRW
jgi:hypothetical protein